jgi:predicted RNA-binding Zn-ribbon protein involved in translation (DUF1610 family)
VTNQDSHSPVTGVTRFGEPASRGMAARFRCARCGDLAGVVRVSYAGNPVDMGSPLGKQVQERDGLVLDYFLGTAWHAAAGDKLDAVQALIERGKVDPLAIRELDSTFWELTPFYCPDCGLNYCSRDWDTYVLIDEGSTTAPGAGARKAASTCSMTDRCSSKVQQPH